MPAPVVGAGAAQEVVDTQEDVPLTAALLREDQIQNAVAFLSHPKVSMMPSAFQGARLRFQAPLSRPSDDLDCRQSAQMSLSSAGIPQSS